MLDMSLEPKISSLPYLSFMEQQESQESKGRDRGYLKQDQREQQGKVAAFSSSCWRDQR